MDTDLPPEEAARAIKEAQAKGLPEGWRVKLDKRRRRKWIAPTGKSCDSIPKAIAISIEIGLLPPDTIIPMTSKKRAASKDPPLVGAKSIANATISKSKGITTKKQKTASSMSNAHKSTLTTTSSSETTTTTTAVHHTKSGYTLTSSSNTSSSSTKPHGNKSSSQVPPKIVSSQKVEILEPIDDEESDPEESLEPTVAPTVHWDPVMGKLVGWRIRIWDTKAWREGRVLLYDGYTNKHKVEMDNPKVVSGLDENNCIWLRLIHETVQYATRLVWAHVKGFAWWPAMVMDGDALDGVSQKKGHVYVNFFVTNEVSSIKDSTESLRPFRGGQVDEIIIKHKKKRNARAIQVGREENAKIVQVRNQASRYNATKAFGVANHKANHLLGRRIEIHRDDVNYPYGDTVVGVVRQYSPTNKKWLVAFELSQKTRMKYPATWMNLTKDSNYKIIDKKRVHDPKETDLLPFLHGFQCVEIKDKKTENDDQQLISKLKSERCWGCVDYLLQEHETIHCSKCDGDFHIGCVEPDYVPPVTKHYHNVTSKKHAEWVCSRCTSCKGCWRQDVAFGCHVFVNSDSNKNSTSLPMPDGGPPALCNLCTSMYERKQYCPNCAHTWDDLRYQRVHSRDYSSPFFKPGGSSGGRGRKSSKNSDDELDDEIEMDPSVPIEADWYCPDTNIWGYTAGNMLGCDQCGLWVHSGCSGLSRDDYEQTSSGKHPIYSKEFLCRICCRQRCAQLVEALQKQDKTMLFALPVTEDVAPTYHDIIKKPMDLQTMFKKAQEKDHQNYAWIREDFELMCLNALTFNSFHSKVWTEAKRYYHECMENVFAVHGQGAPPGKYKGLVDECFRQAEKERKMEEQRVKQDETTEKKDLVAGALVATITLPPLRTPPDQKAYVPFTELRLKPVQAYYYSWMECCFTCGSSGAADTMLFCVDCGEGFHSFCANAPIHSMDASSVSGWRCPNCKICEISGEVPQDETKMLFCEMCDRAFTADLLDPPLKGAPDGLWICGQCVDCTQCNNLSEKKGASVKHWSRDPGKCYRCGGCEGLVDSYSKNMRCGACNGLRRKDDDDVVECSSCSTYIHAACDPLASRFLKEKLYGTRGGADSYECISCRETVTPEIVDGAMVRKALLDQARTTILEGESSSVDAELKLSTDEIQEHLCQEIDWSIREMWSDEFLSVIQDGFTMITAIKRRDLDPRTNIQNCLAGAIGIPRWVGHRAARFLTFAENSGWDRENLPVKTIQSAQVIARMAAAYLRVNCTAFQLQESIEVRAHARMLTLLNEPNDCDLVDIPIDAVRVEETTGLVRPEDIPGMDAKSFAAQASVEEDTSTRRLSPDSVEYLIAEPLIGWDQYLEPSDTENRWSDPRICCLCRTCGDDDGDLDREVSNGLTLARCGRLLPFQSLWVHASCALWSSEVYESQSNGDVHAMEKARSRGSQLKCFGCGRSGASVGCNKLNCSRNYHFPCAKACGAVFTSTRQMFCEAHTSSATELLPTESVEHMRSLMIAEKEPSVSVDDKKAIRIGTLTVLSLGEIEQQTDGFHCEKYITPPGYVSTRIFWSTKKPKTRTLYVLKVEKDKGGDPLFTITPADDPSAVIRSRSTTEAYSTLSERVKHVNRQYFSSGNAYSKLPVMRKHTKRAFGLNGPQFFGFGLNSVRKALERCPAVEAVVAPLTEMSPSYRFCFNQPDVDTVMDLQRKRAALAAENALENSSGCARTEGKKAVTRSTGSGRITRALVRNAEHQEAEVVPGLKRTDAEEKKIKADRESHQQKYKAMKAVPLEERLAARRSHIHGWGLFCKVDLPKDSMIVEYMGEVVRQCIADKREKEYEKQGVGSCYMFRLDLQRIVDATKIGCMARFMNHCCRSNAYAKVVAVDSQGLDKKIIVFANRDIAAGEEITYDYKFPVEDGSLKCTCGAPNCIGRMN